MEKIILHEKYSPISEANDIALLKVTPPVVCGHLIGPGCLPQFKAGPPQAAQTCWVAGWGFLKETGEYPAGFAGHCTSFAWCIEGNVWVPRGETAPHGALPSWRNCG